MHIKDSHIFAYTCYNNELNEDLKDEQLKGLSHTWEEKKGESPFCGLEKLIPWQTKLGELLSNSMTKLSN